MPSADTPDLARGSGAAQKLLAVTALDDAVAVDARARLQAVVEKNFELTNLMVKAYSPYAWLLSAQTDRKIDDFNSQKHNVTEVTAEIGTMNKAARDLAKRSLPDVRLNLNLVSCAAVRTKLTSRAEELAARMRGVIGAGFIKGAEGICTDYGDMYLRLSKNPETEEQMVELERYLAETEGILARLNAELNEGRKSLRFLIEQAFAFSEDELKLIGDTWHWPHKIKPKIAECQKKLKDERYETRPRRGIPDTGDDDARPLHSPRPAPSTGATPRTN